MRPERRRSGGLEEAAEAGKRLVSLVPSITETLLGWGVTPVGVTRFCEAPGIPTVGGTKNPDIRAIVALEPDVVLMDRQENTRTSADALGSVGIPIVVTDVRSLADVGPALVDLAEAAGVRPGSAAAVDPGSGPSISCPGPRVLIPIWRRPWMSIGAETYGSSLLETAGFVNACAGTPDPYPTFDLDEAAGLQPDFVLAPSEPYRFGERHRGELERVAPVIFVDGQDLFWWGIRTERALKAFTALAAVLRDSC